MLTRERKTNRGCCAITKKGHACPINADRYLEGAWYCHVHDPDGLFQRQVRGEADVASPPDIPGQMIFSDLASASSTALHGPPTDEQAKVIKRRLVAWSKQDA